MAKHRTHSIEFKRQVARSSWWARPFMGSPNDMTSAVILKAPLSDTKGPAV